VLFNARCSYPILGVLFVDFGLSIEQYALLNVAWAVTIVSLEVPSGALADQLGRRKMVILAALLMVVEMAVFSLAPRGNPRRLFALFLLNRILSGAAEASAAGPMKLWPTIRSSPMAEATNGRAFLNV
jgi:MFS family permease